jgi:hypothetical protein
MNSNKKHKTESKNRKRKEWKKNSPGPFQTAAAQ